MEYTSIYHGGVAAHPSKLTLPLELSLVRPGLRLGIGLSGGADSVALTRALAARRGELGVVLHAAHLHHGLRGAEADGDREFCAELAGGLGMPFHSAQVDAAAEAATRGESIEEAARRLRYGWFRELMAAGTIDAVATAHTLDDQAETVLGKLLRGAWTEGLGGISPEVGFPEGRVVRPLLLARRFQVEEYLREMGQSWREDGSNRDVAFTRNRLRHELLPELERWNPQIRSHLAHMAELARDEEAWWEGEVARRAPEIVLSGRAVRGGGRANTADSGVALDIVRLSAEPVAMQRRLLRYAAARLGVALDFEATEGLRRLASQGRAGEKLALAGPLTAERTPRELRISPGAPKAAAAVSVEEKLPVPGECEAFGWRFRAVAEASGPAATIRNWRAGDRVTLRYSSGPRRVKEVLERMKISGEDRLAWLVVEWQGEIVWMQGVEVQPGLAISIQAERLRDD